MISTPDRCTTTPASRAFFPARPRSPCNQGSRAHSLPISGVQHLVWLAISGLCWHHRDGAAIDNGLQSPQIAWFSNSSDTLEDTADSHLRSRLPASLVCAARRSPIKRGALYGGPCRL